MWSKKTWTVDEKLKLPVKPKVFSYEEAQALQDEKLRKFRVDISGESGIMKMGKAENAFVQKPPDFSKYTITDSPESLVNAKKTLINEFGLSEKDINLGNLKNSDALDKLLEQFVKIQKETNFKLPNLHVADIIDGDECCIAGFKPMEKRFYISSRYFNSKQALEDTLKNWANNGILPKQAKSIRYLAEHEAAHMRLPDKLVLSEDFKNAHKMFLRSKDLNLNDITDTEFLADCVAIYRNNGTSNPNILKVIGYLSKEGYK